MPEDQEKQWREIPFRARPTNRISPFAITINERRPVFVENIQSFFNFLTPQSVDVLTRTQTKAFICSPVTFGDNVLGLICALDIPDHPTLTSDVVKTLDVPSKYLAYHLEQIRINGVIAHQEQVLSRFADPALLKMVESSDSSELVVGEAAPCTILIQDLRGSTAASRRESDPKALATKFASIYQTAAQIARGFGASFDKGNGDGTITTLATPGKDNGQTLEMALSLIDKVETRAKELLSITSVLTVIHRGTPFRGIMGNTWRIAWDTCGSDVNDTFSIEKAAKKVDGTLLAISSQVIECESTTTKELLERIASNKMTVEGLPGYTLLFDKHALEALRNAFSPLKQAA
jgi:class 3 adenylate cyclase